MYKIGDKFEIEIGSIYNDSTVSINVKTNEIKDNKLYRIKGFNSLVFDKNGLDKLKKIEEEPPKPKTIKASTLPKDTVVLCGTEHEKRHFATYFNGTLYAFTLGTSSKDKLNMFAWKTMTLEDGTIVLAE